MNDIVMMTPNHASEFVANTLHHLLQVATQHGAQADEHFVIKTLPHQTLLLLDRLHPDFSLIAKINATPRTVILSLVHKTDAQQSLVLRSSELTAEVEPSLDAHFQTVLTHFSQRLTALHHTQDWPTLASLFPTADL